MTDLAQTFRRISLPRRVRRNTILLITAPIAYGIISWLILKSAGNPPVHFRIDIAPLVEAAFVVKLHVLGAVVAFVTGWLPPRHVPKHDKQLPPNLPNTCHNSTVALR